MRIERGIDACLDWRRLERASTPRSVESYRRSALESLVWRRRESNPRDVPAARAEGARCGRRVTQFGQRRVRVRAGR
jgi:hypothetical protein